MPPTLEQMKPFCLSQDFFTHIISPLYNSGNVTNLDGLLDLVKKLHTSLWTKSGRPDGFSGAVAGNFQEILDGYASAVIGGHKVQYGSRNGVGGDTVKEIEVGKGVRLAVTSQFKVTASHAGEVREHLSKAVWQLTGAGGELPESGSRKVVEVIVQDDTLVEPRGVNPNPLGQFTYADWKIQIKEALDHGYNKQAPKKSSDELYLAVDYVYITTAPERFSFLIGGITKTITYMGGGPPSRAHYVFKGGDFSKHWIWLTTTYWDSIKFLNYDYAKIQQVGVGTGAANTPPVLPDEQRSLG